MTRKSDPVRDARLRKGLQHAANGSRDTADELAASMGGCDDPMHPWHEPGQFLDWQDFVDRVARPVVESEDAPSPEEAEAVMQAALRARGLDVVLVDAAVSGDTTAGGRARLDWALADGADAAFVALGGNDGLRGLSPAEMEANLTAILDALAARGYRPHTPTAIMVCGCAALAGQLPGMTAFATWPPLAIQRDLWAAGGIGAARQAVMERVALPRAALLGRLHDRAAGAAFVAADGPVAMIHAIEVAPAFRRQGMAGWLLGAAADWALSVGADRLALAVGRANTAARAAYDKLGFAEVGAYDYWSG